MDMKTYLRSLGTEDERASFALRCGTTLGHLRNCIYVEGKRIALSTCAAVEMESGGKVTCEELRADMAWARIPDAAWPWHPAGRPLLDVSATKPQATPTEASLAA